MDEVSRLQFQIEQLSNNLTNLERAAAITRGRIYGLRAELSAVYLQQHGYADTQYLITSREYLEWHMLHFKGNPAIREGDWLKIDYADSTHIHTTPDGRPYRVSVPVELAKTMNKVLYSPEEDALSLHVANAGNGAPKHNE